MKEIRVKRRYEVGESITFAFEKLSCLTEYQLVDNKGSNPCVLAKSSNSLLRLDLICQ